MAAVMVRSPRPARRAWSVTLGLAAAAAVARMMGGEEMPGAFAMAGGAQHRALSRAGGVPDVRASSPVARGARNIPKFKKASKIGGPAPGGGIESLARRKRFNGLRRSDYIEQLAHRRWAAQQEHPRVFGYVEYWDDEKGYGVIMDQEKKYKYAVARDDILKSYHNWKTLQRGEMVEFSATEEIDRTLSDVHDGECRIGKDVTGPMGKYLKTSEEYRNIMLKHGNFPKRWQDTHDEYDYKKTGEWWTKISYNDLFHPAKGGIKPNM